ncbi:hypothetical protein CQA49_07225 [Helicobacter sp. MIT 00-7814]|uniref:hypothetical protein n=1 Tax=unclassified Helicobacter TaxID=2593540 RepID=UPI000E1E9FCE|nr:MULTISPECIES: hypothetical protein [unclassified Helicobacter]RDU52701.1 hypothetical protein CQA37_08205 [Helicobacter sp. MIT 99-10781]RDU53135.1 hypothetical protein CQA49_07225 [Helicobacter sp. MIT 00-7814]
MESAVYFSGSKTSMMKQARVFVREMNSDEYVRELVEFAIGSKDFKFVLSKDSSGKDTINLKYGKRILGEGYKIQEAEFVNDYEFEASDDEPYYSDAGVFVAFATLVMNGVQGSCEYERAQCHYALMSYDVADRFFDKGTLLYEDIELWHKNDRTFGEYVVGNMSVNTLYADLDSMRNAAERFAKEKGLEQLLKRFVLVTYEGTQWHFVPNFKEIESTDKAFVLAEPTQKDIDGLKVLLNFVYEHGRKVFLDAMQ